jgi:hypothetical protein
LWVIVSVHVAEKVEKYPPDSLHPTQGSFLVLKLVAQPPLQLLATFSSAAIFANTEPGAGDGVRAVDDVRRDAPELAPGLGLCGLATCFGASTETVGSWAEPVAVCDTAGPDSRTVDKIATAEGATKLGDNFMTIPPFLLRTEMPSQCAHINAQPLAELFLLGHCGLKGRPPMTPQTWCRGERGLLA